LLWTNGVSNVSVDFVIVAAFLC